MILSIETVFAPLIGQPAWLVHRGVGSFLLLNFGQPKLHIREAVAGSQIPVLKRRRVFVEGDWLLWLYLCAWRVFDADRPVARSESDDAAIDAAVSLLDGQALTGAMSVGPGRFSFTFDQGATIETWPLAADDEQWTLYRPDETVVSADGRGILSIEEAEARPSVN